MRSPLSGFAPARRRLVVTVLAVVVLVLVVVTGTLLAGELTGRGTADQSRPGPVLVVPGYGGRTASLAPLVAQLRADGRQVVVFEPTGGGTGDLRVQARRLGDLAEQTMASADSGSVDLVGYSAGGVVVRLYVRDEGGASVVRRVLTLGSPHHGTDVAALAQEVAGGCPTACEQLVTDSELLRRLNAGDETPDGPAWVSVRTRRDQTVTPDDSAVLEGALNIVVQDLCPGATTSHGELPGDPAVLATLRAALGSESPRSPGDVSC